MLQMQQESEEETEEARLINQQKERHRRTHR